MVRTAVFGREALAEVRSAALAGADSISEIWAAAYVAIGVRLRRLCDDVVPEGLGQQGSTVARKSLYSRDVIGQLVVSELHFDHCYQSMENHMQNFYRSGLPCQSDSSAVQGARWKASQQTMSSVPLHEPRSHTSSDHRQLHRNSQPKQNNEQHHSSPRYSSTESLTMESKWRCPSGGLPGSDLESTIEPYFESDSPPRVLDPNNSERQYWRDPYSGVLREIWRPGDKDGSPSGDSMFDRNGLPSREGRWRFYQTGYSKVGLNNQPPRYVVLDDRAAWQVYNSDIPKSHRAQFWPDDFITGGALRKLRRNRGRSAIGDPNARGLHQYSFGYTSPNTFDKYYFIGEQYYRPVAYIDPNMKRKAATLSPTPQEERPEKRARGPTTQTPQKVIQKRCTSSPNKPSGRRIDPLPRSTSSLLHHESPLADNSGSSPLPKIALAAANTTLTINSTTKTKSGPPSGEAIFMDAGNACPPLIPSSSSSHKTNSASRATTLFTEFTPTKAANSDPSDAEDAVQVFPFHLNSPSPNKNSDQGATYSSGPDHSPLRHCTSCLKPKRKVGIESRVVRHGHDIADLHARVMALEAVVAELEKQTSIKCEDVRA
nr:hypothetical protein CFP56_37159 [Quercus suber]